MGPETENKIKDSVINGTNVGRDMNTTNYVDVTVYQDSERDFVVTHNAEIKPVSYFTGRESELQKLRQLLEDGGKCVLVSGMGGIGKTHICRKLFEEYYHNHGKGGEEPFHHIGYIEYNGDMDSSLQQCLKFRKQDHPEQNVEAAWRELEHLAADGKLLLIVDNVNVSLREDPGLAKLQEIPGAIIITSRRGAMGKAFKLFRIDFMDTEQCRKIYERIRFGGSDKAVSEEEESDLKEIIEKMAARHTITIEFLAHLAKMRHWNVLKLRQELEQNGFCLQYTDEEECPVNLQKSYEALYDLSELTEAEQNILEAFSVFPYLPLEVEVCKEWLLADAGAEDDILNGLSRKGWLQFSIDSESYRLHPVFAQFIYEKRKPIGDHHVELVEACVKSLKVADNGSAQECQNYLPFAESIVEKLDFGEHEERAYLMSEIAYLLHYIGEYKRAEEWNMKSLRIREEILGEDHPATASSYHNLAYLNHSQGKYKEAEQLYKKALRVREKVLGKDHPATATSYNNLALLYKKQEKYKEAENLYEKALGIREKILGVDHPDTASSYNNLAGLYEDQGKYKEAENLYEKALRIQEKTLGKEHPDTASSYNNLAGLYREQGKYSNAIECYLISLNIFANKLGVDHPSTQIVRKNLEIAYEESNPDGNFAEWLEENI